jgi:hypothetical protein
LPQAKKVIALLPEVLVGDPEATIYHISSSEPWGGRLLSAMTPNWLQRTRSSGFRPPTRAAEPDR